MDEKAPEVDIDNRAEVIRLQTELEHRTEAWRDALRLVSEAETRCLILENTLVANEPVRGTTVARSPDAGIDWAGLQTSGIHWSSV